MTFKCTSQNNNNDQIINRFYLKKWKNEIKLTVLVLFTLFSTGKYNILYTSCSSIQFVPINVIFVS